MSENSQNPNTEKPKEQQPEKVENNTTPSTQNNEKTIVQQNVNINQSYKEFYTFDFSIVKQEQNIKNMEKFFKMMKEKLILDKQYSDQLTKLSEKPSITENDENNLIYSQAYRCYQKQKAAASLLYLNQTEHDVETFLDLLRTNSIKMEQLKETRKIMEQRLRSSHDKYVGIKEKYFQNCKGFQDNALQCDISFINNSNIQLIQDKKRKTFQQKMHSFFKEKEIAFSFYQDTVIQHNSQLLSAYKTICDMNVQLKKMETELSELYKDFIKKTMVSEISIIRNMQYDANQLINQLEEHEKKQEKENTPSSQQQTDVEENQSQQQQQQQDQSQINSSSSLCEEADTYKSRKQYFKCENAYFQSCVKDLAQIIYDRQQQYFQLDSFNSSQLRDSKQNKSMINFGNTQQTVKMTQGQIDTYNSYTQNQFNFTREYQKKEEAEVEFKKALQNFSVYLVKENYREQYLKKKLELKEDSEIQNLEKELENQIQESEQYKKLKEIKSDEYQFENIKNIVYKVLYIFENKFSDKKTAKKILNSQNNRNLVMYVLESFKLLSKQEISDDLFKYYSQTFFKLLIEIVHYFQDINTLRRIILLSFTIFKSDTQNPNIKMYLQDSLKEYPIIQSYDIWESFIYQAISFDIIKKLRQDQEDDIENQLENLIYSTLMTASLQMTRYQLNSQMVKKTIVKFAQSYGLSDSIIKEILNIIADDNDTNNGKPTQIQQNNNQSSLRIQNNVSIINNSKPGFNSSNTSGMKATQLNLTTTIPVTQKKVLSFKAKNTK